MILDVVIILISISGCCVHRLELSEIRPSNFALIWLRKHRVTNKREMIVKEGQRGKKCVIAL